MIYLGLQNEIDETRPAADIAGMALDRWVYLGEDSAWRTRAERGLLAGVPRLAIHRRMDEVAAELRGPYINWVGELSEVNDGLDWWACELATKNPYTKFFLRICLLVLGRELLPGDADRSVLAVCSSRAVLQELATSLTEDHRRIRVLGPRGWARRGKNAAYRWAMRAYWAWGWRSQTLNNGRFAGALAAVASRQRVLVEQGYVPPPFSGPRSVLLFTWVDRRNFSADGGFVDPHLGPLAQELEKMGYRVGYVLQVLPSIPFGEAVERLATAPFPIYFPEHFLGRRELHRSLRRARNFSPRLSPEAELQNVPLASLVSEHVEEYRASLALVLNYEALVAGLAAAAATPEWIIHTCEGHSWEQALAWSVQKHMSGTRIAGFENGTFSPMMHAMYPSAREFGLRPLPDRVLTYGEDGRRRLVAGGWPERTVRTGCALRHDYICRLPRRSPAKPLITRGAPISILAATGIGPSETIELVTKAVEAFAGRHGYELTIKCHPSVDGEWVKGIIGIEADSTNLRFDSRPVDQLLAESHVVVFTYTTVCYEALPHGVLPVFVMAENFVNLNKMEGLQDIYWSAASAEDLRAIIDSFREMSEAAYRQWYSAGKEAVAAAFSPVGEERIRAFVAED